MTATIDDIIQAMEFFAPSIFAEDWDNVGLQVGKKDWPVRLIWVALDPLPEVVAAACKENVDLLITHHPLIFKPLCTIDLSTTEGSIIQSAVLNKIGIFAAHTNLDSAQDGLNDILAHKLGLKNINLMTQSQKPFAPCKKQGGFGRLGELEAEMDLCSFVAWVKEKMRLKSVKVAGNKKLSVRRVAICSGSGSGLINEFLSSGAQIFVSGDLRYHDARAVEAAGLGLVDIGHFASEHLMVESITVRLKDYLTKKGIDVKVEACKLETDPFSIF